MHEYLMEVVTFYNGVIRFQVSAENCADARYRARETVDRMVGEHNWYINSIKVVRKLKPSFGCDKDE